ncbi:terpenoid synthase [Ceraceosorus guamensis]|uniref:Bifunctional lycopene cyclase/phytoene synthase n=1 Tax=Ceraceosorus guamensis TaxID=1522189 RepID=A0A316VYQ6_9BASI|nr:terpenoid synthase [Ceraceosorus guamensis]PWN42797.1 terpenoid synthase [Ceraceosorus guamensis]
MHVVLSITVFLSSFISSPSTACLLRYSDFHLRFTLPSLALLYGLARPFLARLDKAKLMVISLLALVWTTPWDNVIVKNKAWSYPETCVLARIGHVPVEEYAFFIIQSLITTLFATLILRWQPPTASQTHRRRLFLVPIVVFCVGLHYAKKETHTYYGGMIAWWVSVPLTLLWFGVQGAWQALSFGRKALWLSVWIIPTLALCAADRYAMQRGTWHINEATSVNIFPVSDLPIEEAAFFAVTNLLLLSAFLAFDTTVFHLRVCAPSSVAPLGAVHLPFAWSTVGALWKAFISFDSFSSGSAKGSMERSDEADDVRTALRVLEKASKSFAAAAKLLPWDLRRDLSCLYALCRAADDVVDEVVPTAESKASAVAEGTSSKRNVKLDFLHGVIEAVFDPSKDKSDSQIRHNVLRAVSSFSMGEGDDGLAADQLEEVRACACACISLRHILPLSLFRELLRGYEMDLKLGSTTLAIARFEASRTMRTEEQLMDYCQCVAGVIGEMVVRVVLGRTGHLIPKDLAVSRDVRAQNARVDKKSDTSTRRMEELLWNARNMGVALQLINIARDVVSDAQSLQRCYLVILKPQDEWISHALSLGKIRCFAAEEPAAKHNQTENDQVPTTRDVRPHVLALLDRAENIFEQSLPALRALPCAPARAGLRAACCVYAAIAHQIRAQEESAWERGERAFVSFYNRLWIALCAVYAEG